MTNDLQVVRTQLPKDSSGNVMQTGNADSVQLVTLETTAQVREVAVPPDAVQAAVWAVAHDEATTIAFKYGGARAGAPASANMVSVPTGVLLTVFCAGAPSLYFQAVGAACDICIQWIRKEIV